MSELSQALGLKRELEPEDLDLIERVMYAHARDDFYEFRRMITPGLIEGWWQKEVAAHLEQFWWDWCDGLTPVLVLMAPPQHGKSRQVIDFVSWVSGHNPNLKTIYTSYSDDLGLFANTTLQRIMDTRAYRNIFPGTQLSSGGAGHGRTVRNSYMLEYSNATGSFRNTTVRGQITGMGLELGLIDDPIKGREEASSITIRDKTWNWFTDDFFSRFSETAALLMIMTRWHLDDPVGRFIERFPHAKVLRYPALGRKEAGGLWIADDKNGDPLFPQLKSKEFLLKRKVAYTISSWMSLYQQTPIVAGGDLFPIEKFTILPVAPDQDQIKRTVRYWDKAGTEGGTGAYTAGVLMHELQTGKIVVEHVVRGHWSALERETRIKQCAQMDNLERVVETWVEQEPGSGGKESAEGTVLNLRGYKAFADRVTGKKEIRAEPYAAQVQAGNVALVAAPWNRNFLDEHEMFPNGKYKDQVDAAGAAFLKLTVRKSTYDGSLGWVKGATE
jgi:predicted phage terminase large subunit-like protein